MATLALIIGGAVTVLVILVIAALLLRKALRPPAAGGESDSEAEYDDVYGTTHARHEAEGSPHRGKHTRPTKGEVQDAFEYLLCSACCGDRVRKESGVYGAISDSDDAPKAKVKVRKKNHQSRVHHHHGGSSKNALVSS